MRIRGRRAVAIIWALGLCTAAAGADDALAFKVQRRAHGGDVFNVQMAFEQTIQQETGPEHVRVEAVPIDAPLKALTLPATLPAETAPAGRGAERAATTQTIRADLTCQVEVQDVNFHGETLMVITVKKFVTVPEGRELVPAGKEIGMQGDAVDVFFTMHGGGVVSEEARAVLRHVYPLSYRLDDQSYGSKTPRKAGESWEVDAESVAQMDSTSQTLVDKASVKGRVTLVGLEKPVALAVPGVRLKIELAHAGTDRIRRQGGELFTREELQTQTSLLLPMDEKLPALQMDVTSDSHAVGSRRKTDSGKTVDSDVVVDTHTVIKQTIVRVEK